MPGHILLKLHRHPIVHPENGGISAPEEEYNKIIAKVGSVIRPGAGGGAPFEASNVIIDLFINNLRAYVESLGGIDRVIAVAQSAYDKYVAPIDIPQVPNFLEPAVDQALKYVIGVILRAAWDHFQKQEQANKVLSEAAADPANEPTPVEQKELIAKNTEAFKDAPVE